LLAATASEAVIVRIDGTQQAYALSRLAHGVVVYRFDAAKSVQFRYALTRAVVSSIPDGQFHLHQLSSGSATKMFGPWMAGTSAVAAPSSLGCDITVQSGTACGVTYTASPFFAPPTNIGGTFTSQAGTSASTTITITFVPAVAIFQAVEHDPTFAGSKMVAYDSTGTKLDSISFKFTGTPGDNVPDTETVTGQGHLISRIDLIPAAADYVSYDASFAVDYPVCPPDGDPLMDRTIVRQQMAQIYTQSGVGSPTFKEIMIAVYRNTDGSLSVIQPPTQVGTACTVTFPLSGGLADPTLLGIIHVHGLGAGQPSPCPDALTADSRGATFGLGGDDMTFSLFAHLARAAAMLPDIAMDVIDIDKIWRNNPSLPASQQNTIVDRVPKNCKWS